MTKDTEALREAVEQVKQLAQRDMARTQTDFLGRMGQELCDFEAAIEPYPDGELPDDVRGDAYDAISGLAGLAFAQMLMLRGCDHTIFATPASDVVAGGEALREALRRARDYLLEVGNDYPGSSCQKWCAEKATEIWNTLKPWEHCPSTHCERAQQCRSPNECSANTAALKGPAA